MGRPELTDNDIVQQIKDEKLRNGALKLVYIENGWRDAAIAFVRKQGGSEQDGQEVAQSTLIAFDRAIRGDKYLGQSSLKTYFLAIAKNQWYKYIRDNKRQSGLDSAIPDTPTDSVEALYLKGEHEASVRLLMAQFGERCKKLFEMERLGATMKEIAAAMNFSNSDMAKKEVYRCWMRLRGLLEKHPAIRDRFK
ncbi:MAG: RNA polymerase sigma factor [Saprospiraceae bacterium]|nr:RNA polymerase sigma factor [Saprospiraceae bacterium]